jgi:hypothetical protein
MHATCVLGPPADLPAARTAFFNGSTGAKYNIGGFLYSADDIEHGIIRLNKRYYKKKKEDRFLCFKALYSYTLT